MSDDRIIPAYIADEMAALERRPIDLSEMPEATDWSKARRGLWHRIYRDDLIVMLEPKVMAWFAAQGREGEDVNDLVNRVMREQVIEKNRDAA
jgi:hypothetical protein